MPKELPKIKASDITGRVIFQSTYDIDCYDIERFEIGENEGHGLNGGVILQHSSFTADQLKLNYLGGSEDYNGSLQIWLYENGTIGGNFSYAPEAMKPKQTLNGHYFLVNDTMVIKGLWFWETEEIGYLIKLKMPSGVITDTSLPAIDKLIQVSDQLDISQASELSIIRDDDDAVISAIEAARQEQQTRPLASVLNKEYLAEIVGKARKAHEKYYYGYVDAYEELINLNLVPGNSETFIKAAALGNAVRFKVWDINKPEAGNFNLELEYIKKLGMVTSLDHLAGVFDGSFDAAIYTVKVFYPFSIPIFDADVLAAWHFHFSKKFKLYPELELRKTYPSSLKNTVQLYLRYWKLMLLFKDNCPDENVRSIESTLYWSS